MDRSSKAARAYRYYEAAAFHGSSEAGTMDRSIKAEAVHGLARQQ